MFGEFGLSGMSSKEDQGAFAVCAGGPAGSMAKRAIDIGGALAGLVVLSPVMALVAAAIWADSGRPIIFKQKRLGYRLEEFLILKFRTMQDGAEQMGTGIRTHESDPRLTRVGKVLRKFSLDELPQLINVLKGEMSLVGPRPPVTYHPKVKSDYSGRELVRFMVRPGMTGLAQVIGRNALTWEERFVLDAKYVEDWSHRLDLRVFLRTFGVLVDSEKMFNSEVSGDSSEGKDN